MSRNYKILTGIAIIIMGLTSFFLFNRSKKTETTVTGTLYDFKMRSLNGQEIDFSKYRNQNLLIVNTASKCGYTYQYADLQKLHEQYGHQITILGFPANNFLWQEPGTNNEIEEFCQINYGVTFQMFEKISVKGNDQHPLYQWLEAKSGEAPSWNFCKYLIDKNGNVVSFYGKKVRPIDRKIVDKILSLN